MWVGIINEERERGLKRGRRGSGRGKGKRLMKGKGVFIRNEGLEKMLKERKEKVGRITMMILFSLSSF